tara:strand:- start:3298 stop:3915 length:618 start_codon:yes stop_codon:yes gene_type:complete
MLAASECGFIIDPDRIEGKFEDFIGVYRRFVHHDICSAIVKNFETYIDINPEIVQHGKDQMPDKKLARHDVSIMLDDVDMGLATHFYKYLNSAFGNYKQEYDHLKTNLNAIGLKVQRTSPGGGYHTWHYENGSFRAANRELAWMVYLNDMPDGEAETEFLYQKKRYKPQTGTLLIWPAGMTHVHRGNTVFTHDKYIATGWFLKLP